MLGKQLVPAQAAPPAIETIACQWPTSTTCAGPVRCMHCCNKTVCDTHETAHDKACYELLDLNREDSL